MGAEEYSVQYKYDGQSGVILKGYPYKQNLPGIVNEGH